MDNLEQKQFTTSRSFTYNYYISPSSSNTDSAKPTLVFLHGFPTTAHLFANVIPHFINLPYRIIVPDLLGHGETSKPIDLISYSSKKMNEDLLEILDHEGVGKIIPIGHDMGSWFAQRVYVFNKDRCSALVLLSVAYSPPNTGPLAQPVTLERFQSMTFENSGYRQYEYFTFFLSPEAPTIMHDHAESMYHLIHGAEKDAIRKYYCEVDAFRAYIESDTKLPVREYANDPEMKGAFVKWAEKYGFEGPLAWYHAIIENVQFEAEKTIQPKDVVINHPLLFIGSTDDAVARADAIERIKPYGLAPDLTVKVLDASHYIPLEKPDEVAEEIINFLRVKNL
ncbi:hypothetical protein BP6252_11371 [Coleophoma cylindrospora]|uniref:AB hydrolase-1 domain-containing protein n=1 Tax=Coleophoma cylindrospora TaxID=1849047 RepID=A0A3D8QJP7_9HELO|nr:hypothetical protein BP6252_11371 [Coleophoma cylindrospora]